MTTKKQKTGKHSKFKKKIREKSAKAIKDELFSENFLLSSIFQAHLDDFF